MSTELTPAGGAPLAGSAPPEGADDQVRAGEDRHRDDRYNGKGRLKSSIYEAEMERLQEQLVQLQYWVQSQGLKVAVIFEGRGSAGKGGVIKRITERTSPRTVRVVALPQPTERERSGTSSATSSTCPRRERWCCSIAAGTTDRMSSG
jgi:polyphosphate kinase 2 (PPK2 family)